MQAIILGIVQGATEFIPISSSGHLVLVPHLLGWKIPMQEAFVFDVLVQLGSMLAVIIYFRNDLLSIARATISGIKSGKPFEENQSRMGWYLIPATLPAVLVGFTFRNTFHRAFESVSATGFFLLCTALLLIVAEKAGKRSRSMENLGWVDVLWTGAFQALALFPGVSRSGATITGAMSRDLDRPAAARFSFLMAIPVMLAAGAFATLDGVKNSDFSAYLPVLMVGFITSAIVGYVTIRWLLNFLDKSSLNVFAIYCALIGALLLITG
jgi:undecaprenyl-diphosphatase